MAKIKVLHCQHSPAWGGLEIYTVDLIKKLASLDIEQTVLCAPNSKVYFELKTEKKIKILTLPPEKISKISHAWMIRKIIKTKGITHLHSHNRVDMWACSLALIQKTEIKHIYNLYMNAPPKRDFVHKWLFSKVDALCTSSNAIASDVKQNFPISPEKVKIIRYGRAVDDFIPYPMKREELHLSFGTETQQICFGMFCRIDPGKGVKEFIDAFDHLTEEEQEKTQLWLVGDPTIEDKAPDGTPVFSVESLKLLGYIRQKRQERGFKIAYLPFQKNYIPYIDALDVFVMASYNETYALSVIDAMLMKKPVIGTQAGGTIEQVGNNRGLLVKPKSASDIARAMSVYLKNPEKIKTDGESARAWALDQHEWSQAVAQVYGLYQNL